MRRQQEQRHARRSAAPPLDPFRRLVEPRVCAAIADTAQPAPPWRFEMMNDDAPFTADASRRAVVLGGL